MELDGIVHLFRALLLASALFITSATGRAAIGRMVDDVRGQLVQGLGYDVVVTARYTLLSYDAVDHGERRLRVVALGAEHELAYEGVEQVEQLIGVVRAVHDELVRGHAHLGAELAPEVLGRIGGRPTQRLGHRHHVRYHCLDAVAAALHFGRQLRHLVPFFRFYATHIML